MQQLARCWWVELLLGVFSLVSPSSSCSPGFADILGFVFLLIGIIWTVQTFAERVFKRAFQFRQLGSS